MFVVLGSRTEATQRLPRGMTANRMGLSSYDGDHDRKCNPWHPGGGLADDDVVIDAPPIITSGIKIKTTFDTSTPAITAAISPIAATMANTPKPSHQSVARTWVTQERRSYAGGCPRSASRNMPTAPPVASGPPRSRSGVGEGAVCGFAGTSLTTEVLLWTIRRMAVGLGLVLVLLGVAMLVNFERIDAWQQRRFLRRPITPTRWQARRSSCSE